MKKTKGIILAGGNGTRLYPLTTLTNKQFLPIYNKPAIYYPLTTLMLAGIKDILIISNPSDKKILEQSLGNGNTWNINLSYAEQLAPRGIPEAFTIGEEFIGDSNVALILGDNFFHGPGFSEVLENTAKNIRGAHLFAYPVSDPKRFGIVSFDREGKIFDIEEKPENPKSRFAVTGLYFYDNKVVEYAKKLSQSPRGELEITDLNNMYVANDNAYINLLGRGFVWFDVGTPLSLNQASSYVHVLEEQQAIGIACPEEVSWRMGWITDKELKALISILPASKYSEYLENILLESQELLPENYALRPDTKRSI